MPRTYKRRRCQSLYRFRSASILSKALEQERKEKLLLRYSWIADSQKPNGEDLRLSFRPSPSSLMNQNGRLNIKHFSPVVPLSFITITRRYKAFIKKSPFLAPKPPAKDQSSMAPAFPSTPTSAISKVSSNIGRRKGAVCPWKAGRQEGDLNLWVH